MAVTMPDRLKPVLDFTIQVIVGAVMFAVVFLVAVGLAGGVHLVERTGWVPQWVATMGQYAEMLLYGADLFGFVLFLLKEVLTLARGLWSEWKQ